MGDNKNFVKDITNIEEDFAKWYTDIVLKAELADYTNVICTRGSMGNTRGRKQIRRKALCKTYIRNNIL